MIQLLLSSAILSILHSIIPNHWLPVLAIGKKESWSLNKTTYITFIAGSAHALSTILIGLIISALGVTIGNKVEVFTQWIAPGILILMGLFFIWQHYKHHHFHLHEVKRHEEISQFRIIFFLALAMFFSPCLEIEALYLMAGGIGWQAVTLMSMIYLLVSVTGMVVWVHFAYRGLQKFDFHAIEHNAGMITGGILVLTGLMFFFFH
jgi:nickel/cobalt transporter (NicO) family protein